MNGWYDFSELLYHPLYKRCIMADVSKVKVGSTTYDLKDATARTYMSNISVYLSGNTLYFKNYAGTVTTVYTF